MSDRKFVFNWDPQDDTFADELLLAHRRGAQTMFAGGILLEWMTFDYTNGGGFGYPYPLG